MGQFQDLASAEAAAKEKAKEIREQFPPQAGLAAWGVKTELTGTFLGILGHLTEL